MVLHARRKRDRGGVAAVEFAVCLPLMLSILLGLWEIGRMVEIEQIMYNCARESARDASMAQDNLQTIAGKALVYLQSAEPQAFAQGHSTTIAAASSSLVPTNGSGYTCKDSVTGKELFTITFTDLTTTTATDPTGANKLDNYQLGIQVPYSSVQISPLFEATSSARLYANVNWLCMKDTPFQVSPVLPAQ